jgi:class 3 adenylate cyclase
MGGTGGPGHVLVVDDSRVNRMTLVKVVETLGHSAIEADDGQVAIDLLRSRPEPPIDVVLLDLVMPGLDGYETLRMIKEDEALATTPVIVVSGVDELESIVRIIRLGALDHLTRPVQPALLGARLNAALADKRVRDVLVENARLVETVERQKSELTRFISPQIADLITSPEGEQLLAGHRRRITVVMCDLRGFTSFSEAAEPEEVLGVLRDYHATLGRIIVDHGGTLEHFAGDGVMVYFNDPVLQDGHEAKAVGMALAMRDAVAGLATAWHKLGYELGFGVGIVAGYATLGRIGFEGRYDYGAVGNAVNLSARLCAEARAGQILLDQRTWAAVEEVVEVEPIGELNLKGLHRPVPAYNVTALRTATAVSA